MFCLCYFSECCYTSDIGIAKKCDTYGIDVLLTDDSSIVLNGVSHGFIGGSAGLIAPSLLAVIGNLVYHKNFEEIEEFCGKYNVEIVSLHDGFIQDIGTIVSVTI